MKPVSRSLLYLVLFTLLAVLSFVSLLAGKVWVPWGAWVAPDIDPRWAIIFELRLPRTILAIAVGAALGAVLTLYYGVTAEGQGGGDRGAM